MSRKPSETVGLTLRLKESLREKLERSARERGTSLNSETVRRLEDSFVHEQHLADVFGSEEVFALMRTIASVMDTVGRRLDGPSWARDPDPEAYKQALQKASVMLSIVGEEGPKSIEHIKRAVESGFTRNSQEDDQ